VGLRMIVCWDCGFECCWGHGCLSHVNVLCCQVEISATGRALVQMSPTECVCVTECVREASTMRGPRSTTAAELREKIDGSGCTL